MKDLSNKVALITGASGGLGRALCAALAAGGARLVLFDRDEAALAKLVEELHLDEFLSLVGDITDAEDIDRLQQEVQAKFGTVDILIHNAGVTHFSRFADSGPEVTARVMSINFMGAVNLTAALLPMIRASGGTIVAISSVAGFAPLYGRTGYSASKHAMHGFFESLRGELEEDGVHVMLACPSFIATQEAGHGSNSSGLSRPGSATATAGKPLAPEYVAARILAGIKNRKRQLVIGKVAQMSWFVSRLMPSFFEKKMLENTKSEVPED